MAYAQIYSRIIAMKIWKWMLDITDRQTIYLPLGAQILTVEPQRDQIFLWALCDPSRPVEARYIGIHSTAGPLPADIGKLIGSIQLESSSLVFHAFEVEN
jgi:hypothetical protein